MTEPTDPAAIFAEILAGPLHAEVVDTDATAEPTGPRVPAPNPMQGRSGNPIPDATRDARAFVEATQDLIARGPQGGWHDLFEQARGRGY